MTGRVTGRLLLVPNALDLGADQGDLREVIALPVLETAARLTHWVVEDARSARAFLKRVAVHVPLALPLQAIELRAMPRARKGSGQVVPRAEWRSLLQPALAGNDIGVLSEAGLPAVADPGAGLVEAAHEIGVPVQALPGASSLMLALAASGLNGQSFAFVGYLPQDAAARSARLRELEAASRQQQQTQLMIETPYRNGAFLAALLATLAPTTRLSVSCGLTLAQGWTRTSSIAQWRASPTDMPDRLPAVFAFLAG